MEEDEWNGVKRCRSSMKWEVQTEKKQREKMNEINK